MQWKIFLGLSSSKNIILPMYYALFFQGRSKYTVWNFLENPGEKEKKYDGASTLVLLEKPSHLKKWLLYTHFVNSLCWFWSFDYGMEIGM